jgi:hypothetical protein
MFGLSLVSQLPLLRSQSCLLVAPLCAVGSAIVASPADTRPAIPTTHPHPHAPQARRTRPAPFTPLPTGGGFVVALLPALPPVPLGPYPRS